MLPIRSRRSMLSGVVVNPLRRVSNAWVECRELGARLLFRRLVHPGGRGDSILQASPQVGNQLRHLAIALGRIVPLDVNAADGLAQIGVDQLNAALPPFTLLGYAAQRRRVPS